MLKRLAFSLSRSAAFLVLPALGTICAIPAAAQVTSPPKSKAPLTMVLGEPNSVQVAQAYGSLVDALPLIMPPGRHGVEPHIALTYNSQMPDGILGLGWDIDLGYIEIDAHNGLPSSRTSTALYQFSYAGVSGELENDGTGVYHSRTEVVYRQFTQTDTGGWLMWDGEGNSYFFGSTSASRECPNNASPCTLWLLDEISDPSGNTLNITYLNSLGALYPSTINYTGTNGGNPTNQVVFNYGERSDVRLTNIHGVPEERVLRLESIEADVLAPTRQMARKYQFNYTQTAEDESSLTGIVLVGDDGVSTVPLRTMQYTTATEGWDPSQSPAPMTVPPYTFAAPNYNPSQWRLIDLDGDGCADLVQYQIFQEAPQYTVNLGDCTGSFTNRAGNSQLFQTALDNLSLPPLVVEGTVNGEPAGVDNGVVIQDVNGDGRPDIVVANGTKSGVWLNTYDGQNNSTIGWTAANWSMPVSEPNIDPVDGVGNCPNAGSGTTPFTFSYTGTAYGIVNNTYITSSSQTNPGVPAGVTLVDVNGDGLPDIVWTLFQLDGAGFGKDVCIAAVYLNTGTGWVRNNALSHALSLVARQYFTVNSAVVAPDAAWGTISNTVPTGWQFIDVNGDGMADMVYTGLAMPPMVLLFNGSQWGSGPNLEPDPDFTASLKAAYVFSYDLLGEPQGFQFVDYNHDGLPDIVSSLYQGIPPRAFRNIGTGWIEDPAVEQQLPNLPPVAGVSESTYAQWMTLADINGDGFVDIVDLENPESPSVYFGAYCNDQAASCGYYATPLGGIGFIPEGMLSQSQSALGENTSVIYTRAPAGPALAQFVPAVLERTEARQDQSAQTPLGDRDRYYYYTYSGGEYTNRTFSGFLQVNEIDPNGNTVTTTFDQRNLFVGQTDQQIVRNLYNCPLYQKTNNWQIVTPAINSAFQQGELASATESFYEANGQTCSAQASYGTITNLTYDNHLNVLTNYRNPDTAATGLDRLTSYTYATSTYGNIWTLPSSVTVSNGAGTTVLSSERLFYDGQANGAATIGQLTSVQDAVQLTKYVTQSYTHDQYGNVAAIVDRNGNTTSFAYDSAASTSRVSATDPDGNTIASTFDPRFGYVLTDTDPGGNTTSYQYDAFGRLAEVTKPGDQGLPEGTTHYAYSALNGSFPTGLSVTRTDYGSSTSSTTVTDYYDSYGQIYNTARSSASSQPILYTTVFDDTEMPIQLSRPYFSGNTPVYTAITRDAMHRITQIEDPDQGVTTRSYQGTQVTETDRLGLVTVTTMDPSEHVLMKTLQNGGGVATTQYTYDGEGELTRVQRADRSVTSITYDLLGRRTSMSDPNTGNYTYQYDGQGHMTAVTGPDGRTVHYTYTPSGQLLSRIYLGGTQATLTYGKAGQGNAIGRPYEVTDPVGSLAITYDSRGRAVQRTRYVTATRKSYTMKYVYDSSDRLISIAYPDAYVVNYAYDGGGNVSAVTEGSGRAIANNFTFNASGRLLGLRYGNGTSSSYGYDVLDRMTTLRTAGPGGGLIQNLAYAYDLDSNILSIGDSVYGANQQFTYDTMNRLISAQSAGYGTENYSYDAIGNLLSKGSAAYGMDLQHPERVDCIMVNLPGVTSCANNPLDRINVLYDTRGNVTQLGNTQYGYDAENRLTTETSGGAVVETNIYDLWGERVVQQSGGETRVFIDDLYEEDGNSAIHHVRTLNLLLATVVTPIQVSQPLAKVQTKTILTPVGALRAAHEKGGDPGVYLYSSMGFSVAVVLCGGMFRIRRRGKRITARLANPKWNKPFHSFLILVLIFTFVASPAGEGRAQSPRPAQDSTREFLKSTVVITSIPAPVPSEQRYFYHMNHLGGVNLITNDSGIVVAVRQYKPYGEMYVNQGSVQTSTTPFTFDGQRLDASGSLYDFHARFYSPQLGRFLSADSEIHDPSTPMALNHYAFAGGNPIRYVDPSGHSWFDFVLGAVIFLVIIAICAATGGAGAAVFALAAGAVGLGIGMGVANALGYSPGSESFWQIAMTGALIGAGIGAGCSGFAVEGVDGAEAADAIAQGGDVDSVDTAQSLRNFGTSLQKSIAFGGPQGVMIHELQGGGTDGLLLAAVQGDATAAASEATVGRVTSSISIGDGQFSLVNALGKTLLKQGAMFTFAGFMKQGLGSWIIQRTVVPVIDSLRSSTNRLRATQNPSLEYPQAYQTESTMPPVPDSTPY